MRPKTARAAHLLAMAACAAVLAMAVAGCKTTSDDVTGSVRGPDAPRSDADWRHQVELWGGRYRDDPSDPDTAIAYARALRATGQNAQAAAVLEQASIRNPHNMPLLGAYGRALADAGSYEQALDVLSRAHTPEQPDWRILNAQGAVLDQLGRHSEAQKYYSTALKIVPNEPSILSNLGLSYALTKDLRRAEATLQQAMGRPDAGPKVRQNLALVIGLEGRFAEAEKIASADLPAAEAAANVRYLREMLSKRGDWSKTGAQPYVPPSDGSN
jgi:Flp pilus assembly protein TadD